MKRLVFVLFGFMLSGCVAMTPPVEDLSHQKRITIVRLEGVHQGMTQQEVLDILKKTSFLGYDISQEGKQISPIEIEGPYREETVEKNAVSYVVAYYLHCILQADDMVSNEELMPFIFKDGRLVDQGWDAVFRLKN